MSSPPKLCEAMKSILVNWLFINLIDVLWNVIDFLWNLLILYEILSIFYEILLIVFKSYWFFIKKYGFFKGSYISFKRIFSCHPIKFLGGGEGFDPVNKKIKITFNKNYESGIASSIKIGLDNLSKNSS